MTIPPDIESIIDDLQKNLPEFLRPRDLIETGLFQSRSDVSWAIKRGQAPALIRLSSHKIVFPRSEIIRWLREKVESGREEVCAK
jgi:predicted DNA-binding transcriptional regulator AlpA